jgi:Flp pilus assembly protein TadD
VHFAKAVELDPQNEDARRCLGAVVAEQECRKALELDPDDPQVHYRLGSLLARIGKTGEAVEHLEEAVRLKPDFLAAVNSLAWLLATCPKDGVRDGVRAVALAERACKATGYKIPALLDTLAAAQAEAGRFAEAIAAATRAVELADAGESPLADAIRARLKLYKAGRPCRQQSQGGM